MQKLCKIEVLNMFFFKTKFDSVCLEGPVPKANHFFLKSFNFKTIEYNNNIMCVLQYVRLHLGCNII